MAKKTQAELEAIVNKRQLNRTFAAEARAIVQEYTEEERATWPIQVEEAKAYMNTPIAETPFIDGIISESGENKEELVDRILQKNSNFRTAIGKALGRKRKRAKA